MNDVPKRKSTGKTIAVIVAIVGGIAGGVWLWDTYKYDFFPKRFGVVEEGSIYRSGQLTEPMMRKVIEDHDIDLVIALNGDEPNDPNSVAEKQVTEELDVDRITMSLGGDGTGDISDYAAAISAMHQAVQQGQPVLVHCAAGAYRTGGVVAAYRMLVQGRPPAEAWAEMKDYDWDDSEPQLPDYLNANMAELAARLVQLGVIDRVPDPLPVLARN